MTRLTRTPTATELQQHARDLATAFAARLIESDLLKPDEAFAIGGGRRCVFVSTIVDETTYAVALHELGHLASPTGSVRDVVSGGNPGNLLRLEEDAAWTWARHYALIWTPVMETVAAWAEGTYAATPPTPVASNPPAKIDWSKWK